MSKAFKEKISSCKVDNVIYFLNLTIPTNPNVTIILNFSVNFVRRHSAVLNTLEKVCDMNSWWEVRGLVRVLVLSLDILVRLTRPQMMDSSQIMRCPGIIKTSRKLDTLTWCLYKLWDKPFVAKIINTRNYINIWAERLHSKHAGDGQRYLAIEIL